MPVEANTPECIKFLKNNKNEKKKNRETKKKEEQSHLNVEPQRMDQ